MIPAGVKVLFDANRANLLVEQWESERLSPWLRAVTIFAGMLYHEQGAPHLRILSLLGNSEEARMAGSPAAYGLSAEISVWELPSCHGSHARQGQEDRTALWISQRLNLLFPHGPGAKKTARYGTEDGVFDRMILEVPVKGYDGFGLTLWHRWGSTGRVLFPQKIRD